MAKTVVGLFDDLQDAQAVVRELEIMGLRREDISVVTKADTAGLPDGRQNIVASGTTKGAEAGAVIGGLAGLLIGLAPIALPGIGVILAGGWLVTTLVGATVGAMTGSLAGALVSVGVEEEEAEHYHVGVQRGGTLVVVRTTDADEPRVRRVIEQWGAVDIQERAAQWNQQAE